VIIDEEKLEILKWLDFLYSSVSPVFALIMDAPLYIYPLPSKINLACVVKICLSCNLMLKVFVIKYLNSRLLEK